MKRQKSFLKKLAFILAFFAVALYQPLCCYAEEKKYVITESQLTELEQDNLIVQKELEELEKRQKEQQEYLKALEKERETLQKQIEKEKETKKKIIKLIPIAFVFGGAITGLGIVYCMNN